MPTTKPRITVTATGELERILLVESRLHPELSPSELVTMLVARGHAAGLLASSRDELVRQLAGGVVYPEHALRDLRDEWPE
jgi:hypothetical protein